MDIFITKANGAVVPIAKRSTATGISSAVQNWKLNAEDTVSITVVSPLPQTYDIGDKITIFGRDYKLNRLPKVKKTGMHGFQYDLEFEGVQYDLMRVTYDLTIDTTSNQLQDVQGDALTGDLHRFMTVLVANANRVFPSKWALGVCPETEGDKTLTFGESDNCLSVLQNLCGESNFNVEFEIVQESGVYTINLHERVGQIMPYTFQYGRGRGLYELTRENVSSANIVTRLKVYGSTENITSKYRADRLCLPGKNKGESYIEKAEMVAKYGIFEGRKNFDDIKPSYTGSVKGLVTGDVCKFVDTDFPFDINEKDDNGTKYMIDGVKPKIHFNSGNLAGYEFEIQSYVHSSHTFALIMQEDKGGYKFPDKESEAFQFGIGDKYKILDISYPASIEQAAESKLEEEGNKYYDQNCQPKVQYGLKVTKEWLQELVGSDETVTNVFRPGDYLHIVDEDICVDKSVRVLSIERNILDPYDYKLTISDTVTTEITNRVISDLVEIDKIVSVNNLKNPARARANWRTSRELLNMVFDPDGDYYTDKIKPQSIDTMALAVGAKSMQFSLLNTMFQPNYSGNADVVKWQGGVLTHYTIKEDAAVSWNMADGSVTLSNNQAYYLYAKCPRSGDAGTFIFSTSQIKVDGDANYYHFLVGTISSIDPDLNARSLALTYGFTMVNGRFIRTGRIESADGKTYFDLDNSEIAGRINFLDGLISGLIGVVNESEPDKILAGLNGSDTGKDAEHGKIVAFYGNAGDADDIGKAITRIYEDGYVYTEYAKVVGALFADRGQLGQFFTTTDGECLISQSGKNASGSKVYELLMSSDKMHYHVLDQTSNKYDFTMSVSDITKASQYAASDSKGNILYNTILTNYKAGFNISLKCNRATQYDYLAALNVSAEGTGAKSMQAIRCDAGVFAGLRPIVRTLSAGGQLTIYDHTVLVDCTSSIRIWLPDYPEAGQTFEIFISNTSSVTYKHTIASLITPMHSPNANIWSANSISVDAYGLIRVTCAKSRNGNLCWWLYRLA